MRVEWSNFLEKKQRILLPTETFWLEPEQHFVKVDFRNMFRRWNSERTSYSIELSTKFWILREVVFRLNFYDDIKGQ